MNSLSMASSAALALYLSINTLASSGAQDGAFLDSKHNLSVSGPGAFRAMEESRMCIFCHTPHRSRTTAPLWNREDSTESYLEYSSTTFDGSTSQPNGSSKLCLSCHDGSIALGMIVSNNREIQMLPGRRMLNQGGAFIGTNLRDDHPISFDYASSEAGGGTEYRVASAIAAPVHLDAAGQVQCTSCHDPHLNPFGGFLVQTDRYSSLCLSCHTPRDWQLTSHGNSTATWNGANEDPWRGAKYSTVAENACANCHRPHSAGQPARLLAHQAEEDNCIHCHNGNVAIKNILSDISKPYGHNPFLTQGVHDPAENPTLMSRHAECEDCHNPHSSYAGSSAPPGVPGPLNGVRGLGSSGQPVAIISNEYELCYKCHASNQSSVTRVPRQVQQINVRLEFDPSNPSFHPIETPGKSTDVPSLLPPWTTASMMSCGDCHQSDSSPAFGGTGAAGPHGSVYAPLLGANYTTTDNTVESASAYALCYRCHNRNSILGDETFSLHRMHIVDERAPCSACHDSHGIPSSQGNSSDNTHLINFDISIVSALPGSGELTFRDMGFRRGTCTMLCHGESHDNESY